MVFILVFEFFRLYRVIFEVFFIFFYGVGIGLGLIIGV